jgi:S1-C subfamily serine protease
MNASVRLLRSVVPTSVTIRATVADSHPSASILGTERMGSGTLVDDGSILLTVNYVVLGAKQVEVTPFEGKALTGEVVAQDFHTGIAAVSVPRLALGVAKGVPSTELQIGQEIFILSSAGDSQRRVSDGAIVSLEAFDAFWEYRLERGILCTAMNPGLGGGGVFTLSGRLAGVVSLDFNEVGRFTLAVPADCFFDHRDELLAHGRRVSRPARAWVGFYCYVLREHVVIAGVVPSGPAERAGLKAGDVILAMNGIPISERGKLYESLWKHQPQDLVTFQVFRDNSTRDIVVESADAELFFA